MSCPDCGSEVLSELAFCFTCLHHVELKALETIAATNAEPKVEVVEPAPSKGSRSWEPGILGTVQDFGRAAARSGWRRTKAEPAG